MQLFLLYIVLYQLEEITQEEKEPGGRFSWSVCGMQAGVLTGLHAAN